MAGSWNFGMKRLEKDCDFVVILSTSICFDKPFDYLIEKVIEYEEKEPAGMYLCDIAKHCFIVTRKGLEIGGYFDENFWPSYYEDMDYSYRSDLNGLSSARISFVDFKMVHAHGISLALKADSRLLIHHQLNANRMVQYYIAKWGGYQNHEIYKNPFDNPKMGVNDWVVKRNDEWAPLPKEEIAE